LYLAISAKFVSNILLLDDVCDAATPNTLCGHGTGKAQRDFAIRTQAVTITLAHSLTHTIEVGELHISVARLLGGVEVARRGSHSGRALFDVDLEDLSELLEFLLHNTRGNVP
jgi:hypothetical protein